MLESKPVNKKLDMIPNDDILVVEVSSYFTVNAGNGSLPCLLISGEWSNVLKLKLLSWILESRDAYL